MRFLELGAVSPCMPTEVQGIAGMLSCCLFLRNITKGWLLLDLEDWLLGQVCLLPFLFRSGLWNEGLDHIRKWIRVVIGSACMNTSRSRWLMIILFDK